jgi:WD40 repeat protein
MTTFMPPPPAATFLAFHPQDNNIIAIGMDDSTIQIYNVRVDEVISALIFTDLCYNESTLLRLDYLPGILRGSNKFHFFLYRLKASLKATQKESRVLHFLMC